MHKSRHGLRRTKTRAGGDTRHVQQRCGRCDVALATNDVVGGSTPTRWGVGPLDGPLGGNPTVGLTPVSYVYEFAETASNGRVALVISAFEVDLRCQIAADDVHTRTNAVIGQRRDAVTGLAESSGL